MGGGGGGQKYHHSNSLVRFGVFVILNTDFPLNKNK